MSTLLEQASLVMIPSGYKEDIVYSQIPTNGNGDLSFTRASNGTRVNSAGLVEVCPWNLLQYSEQFNVSPWQSYNQGTGVLPVITANDTTAPNGTTTADKVVFDTGPGTSASDISTIYQTLSSQAEGVYTASIYAKVASGTAKILLRHAGGGTYTTLNLTTEWQRFEVAETLVGSTSFSFEIGLRRGLSNEPLTSPVTCYLWGAQINVGTAKPYFPTTDRLNVPRLTYQNGGGGCPSLLLEKQSTNGVYPSEDFTNANWQNYGGASVTANTAISPDGTQNADTLDSGTTTALYNPNGVSGGSIPFTASIYVKKVNFEVFRFGMTDDTLEEFSYNYNLDTGAISSASSPTVWTNTSGTITSVGNGWYRLTVTGTKGVLGVARMVVKGQSSSKQYYIWGAQLEASSYATSYIPTTNSSATRVADFDTSSGSSGNFGTLTPTGTKAVLYWELQFHSGSVNENINIGGFRNGTTNQYGMYYWGTNANKNFGFNTWNGDSYGIAGGNSLFDGQVHKIAGVFDFSNFANNVLFIDGVKKTISQTLNNTVQRSANVVSLNSPDYSTQGNKCLLKEFIYFNQNLSDAELTALTTL